MDANLQKQRSAFFINRYAFSDAFTSLCHVFLLVLLFSSTLIHSDNSHADTHKDAVFITGNWVGKAHFDKNGRFDSCTMRALYESGTEIYFVLNEKSGWALGINNKKWNLKVGTKSTATIQIDEKPPVTVHVKVISSQGFYVLFKKKNTLLDSLRRGREMVVYMKQGRKYELKGTSKAIPDLEECAANRSKLVVASKKQKAGKKITETDITANNNRVTASLGSKPDASQSPTQKRADIIDSIEKYLVQKGINFKILAVNEHPTGLDYDVMWRSPNNDYGGVKILTNIEEKNIDKIAGQIIAHDAGMCRGEFASVKKLSEQGAGGPMRSITTVCHKTAKSQEMQYYLYKRKNGSFVKIAQGATLSAGNLRGQNEAGSQIDPDQSIIDSLPK